MVSSLAAASAGYWVLKWISLAPARQTAVVAFADTTQSDPLVVARLLGGGQTSASAAPGASALADSSARRLKLTGVVADRAIGGYALISVDGKPTQPFRVGAQVNDGLILQSVAPRSAALAASADAPASVTLDLPKL